MSVRSAYPDYSELQVPADLWTAPFWDAARSHILLMPRCAECQQFRWPPGPFCPACRSQRVDWVPPGQGRIYSYTLMPASDRGDGQVPRTFAAALVEFSDAAGVRLLASIVDAPLDSISIGAQLEVDWIQATDATVPVFRVLPK
jgi:uncharacterized OB-fold protein